MTTPLKPRYEAYKEDAERRTCYDCGTLLTEEEKLYYSNTCEKCEDKRHQALEEDAHRESSRDTVNHPAHYTAGAIETIDVIKSVCNGQELTPFEGLLLGNIIKYVSRFTRKNGVEDLKKAAWYLERLIGEQEAAND